MNESDDLPDETVAADEPRQRFNGFVPLVLIALSVIIIFGWEVIVAGQARRNGRQLRDQQAKLVEQSKQIQVGLEKIARDLIELAKTDDDAKALVAKYNINISSPAPAASPAASP